jgi:hypothetical protein
MKTSSFIMIVLSGLTIFSGCAPSQQELINADYGSPPQNYEKTIKDLMSMQLKDPYSAQYKFQAPFKGYANRGLIYGGGRDYGWVVKVWINAKNSFGGYTGYEPHVYLFRGERIVREIWGFE